MVVETMTDGGLPETVRMPQTGFYVGASETAAPEVQHVYVLGGRDDDIQVYRYQPASGA